MQAFFAKQKRGNRNRPTEQSEITRNGEERHPAREDGMWGLWHSLGKAPMEQHGLGLVREEGAAPKRLFLYMHNNAVNCATPLSMCKACQQDTPSEQGKRW